MEFLGVPATFFQSPDKEYISRDEPVISGKDDLSYARWLLVMRKAGAMAGLLWLSSCGPGDESGMADKNKEPEKIVALRTQVLNDAQKKRENRQKQVKAMDTAQLANELAEESAKGREPFNSIAFAETVSRGENGAIVLGPLLTKRDRTSLLGLLALRQMSEEHYKALVPELRVRVLVETLRTSKHFNSWGLPHLRWEYAANALIAEGAAAERTVLPLLEDKRDAPVWGSEEFAEYQRYRYRVCDYAWAILKEIRKEKISIPESPTERDRLIQELARL